MMDLDQPIHPLEMEAATLTPRLVNPAPWSIVHKSTVGCAVFGTGPFKPIAENFTGFYKSLLALETPEAVLVTDETPKSIATTEPVTLVHKSSDCAITEPAADDVGPAEHVAEDAQASVPIEIPSVEDPTVDEVAETEAALVIEHALASDIPTHEDHHVQANNAQPEETVLRTEDSDNAPCGDEDKEETLCDVEPATDDGHIVEEDTAADNQTTVADHEDTTVAEDEAILREAMVDAAIASDNEHISAQDDTVACDTLEDTPAVDTEFPIAEPELAVSETIEVASLADDESTLTVEPELSVSDTIEVASLADDESTLVAEPELAVSNTIEVAPLTDNESTLTVEPELAVNDIEVAPVADDESTLVAEPELAVSNTIEVAPLTDNESTLTVEPELAVNDIEVAPVADDESTLVAEPELVVRNTIEVAPLADDEPTPTVEPELPVSDFTEVAPLADDESTPTVEPELAVNDITEATPTAVIVEDINEEDACDISEPPHPESEANRATASEDEIAPENMAVAEDTSESESEGDFCSNSESGMEKNDSENGECSDIIDESIVKNENEEPADVFVSMPAWPMIHEDDFDACISTTFDPDFERFLDIDNSWSIPMLVEMKKSDKDIVKERLADPVNAQFKSQNLRLEHASRGLTIDGSAPVQPITKPATPVIQKSTPVIAPALEKLELAVDNVETMTPVRDNEQDAVELAKAIASGAHSRNTSSGSADSKVFGEVLFDDAPCPGSPVTEYSAKNSTVKDGVDCEEEPVADLATENDEYAEEPESIIDDKADETEIATRDNADDAEVNDANEDEDVTEN
ncbi:hypothetical protein BT67DRAFT_440810 [Trichocladium antarcticum]|uniref:Uncharacterized protein n=1 Tax=Trichocladium antarcticum TaxID=1450529 RepID=A0AAN6UQ93_9PEZI|nr:hypothetical protein BT67DRAFT_440810 [Trichocladium antarcticum]